MQNKELTYNISNQPSTADSLKADSLSRIEAFQSTLAGLVSNYHKGSYLPVLAESWTVSDDHKVWKFKLRDSITFETGEPILAEDVLRSWKRMAYLMKQRDSHSEFFEKVQGIDKFQKINDDIPGLQIENNSIIISLSESYINLLKQLSLGFYSIIHSRDYDSQTGIWNDPQKVTSSSWYRLEEWTDENITLSLRKDFLSNLKHQKAYEKIIIKWEHNYDNEKLIFGDSSLQLPKQYIFSDEIQSVVGFIRIYSWKQPNRPFHNQKFRKCLRHNFYKTLESRGIKTIKSYFPLMTPGVKELQIDDSIDCLTLPETLSVNIMSNIYEQNPDLEAANESIVNSLRNYGFEIEVKKIPSVQTFSQLANQDASNFMFDISTIMTGMLVEPGGENTRFLFLSKEGLRFPDSDGRIKEELAKENYSIQKINELLWDQAIVWPVGHYARGFWSLPEVDLTQLGRVDEGIDFAFVGANN